MTKNQIDWQRNVEQKRANLQQERETKRSNLAREEQAYRELEETKRRNRVVEAETERYNRANMYEVSRHNRETERVNLLNANTTQSQVRNNYYLGLLGSRDKRYASQLSLQSAIAVADKQVSENRRHNQATEAISAAQQRSQAAYNKAAASAQTINSLTNQSQLAHQKRVDQYLVPYRAEDLKQSAAQHYANSLYTLTKESVVPVELGYGLLNSLAQVTKSVGGVVK